MHSMPRALKNYRHRVKFMSLGHVRDATRHAPWVHSYASTTMSTEKELQEAMQVPALQCNEFG